MKEYNYSYTDKVLNAMSKRFITLFNRFKNLADFDELNVIGKTTTLYGTLRTIVDKYFLLLGKQVAEDVGGKRSDITKDWLLDYLEDYDPITEYVFDHEVDRKKERFQESLVATSDKNSAVKKGLSLWDRMIRQYGIEITDAAALHTYEKHGVKKVQWITEIDGRECAICHERHKKVYDIKNVPTKPHINCRCRVIPYE